MLASFKFIKKIKKALPHKRVIKKLKTRVIILTLALFYFPILINISMLDPL